MPAFSSGLFHFHTAYHAMAEVWRRPTLAKAVAQQQRILRARLDDLAATTFGRALGLNHHVDYRDFARRIPTLSPRRLEAMIQRMREGEPDLLCAGRCTEYIRTSSVGANPPQIFPFPHAQRLHLRQALQQSLGLFIARHPNTSAWQGRLLCLDRPNVTIDPERPDAPLSLCQALSSSVPASLLASPTDASATARQQVSMLFASPERVLAEPGPGQTTTADARFSARRAPAAGRPWPRLTCWIHSGGLIPPYGAELRLRLGAEAAWHEVYGGAEGIFAAQDRSAGGQRLLTNTGIFFEFCRAEDADDSRTADLGPRLIPLQGVSVGIDYALFVTTPAGLCRYPSGDIVRFLSLDPPRIVVRGRLGEVLEVADEAVRARDCAEALSTITLQQGWSVVHYHVAPSEQRSRLGHTQLQHEWWIELQPGTAATPTGPVLATLLDAELQRSHPRYAERRRTGALQAPVVRLLMPGVFGLWLESARLHRAQTPVCSSDRVVADALARLARFYA